MGQKIVIITGAFKGIGFATAKVFLQNGHKVILADNDIDMIDAINTQLVPFRENYVTVLCDITNENSIAEMINISIKKFGSITTVVNNAGIFLNNLAEDIKQDDFYKIMNVNVLGMLLVTKYAIPFLREVDGASIVNLSSIVGLIGTKNRNLYVTLKHAVVGMTRNTAVELAREKIRVNAVCPGITETHIAEQLIKGDGGGKAVRKKLEDAYPMGRLAQPSEVAEAIYFLASDKASFITGVLLPVDGGYTAA